MSEWKDIATAPKNTAIMLGKWSEDDRAWYWQASGALEEEGLWIDFADQFHSGVLFQAPTHWRPMDPSPVSGNGG